MRDSELEVFLISYHNLADEWSVGQLNVPTSSHDILDAVATLCPNVLVSTKRTEFACFTSQRERMEGHL